MIDAYEEQAQSSQPQNEVTLAAIKDYLFSKGGKVRYAELFDHFRDQIIDSTSDTKFQEFLSNLAIRKYENDPFDEWIILKKVFYKEQSQSSLSSSTNSGFFASKLQKTKQSLTKFSATLIYQHGKEKSHDLANKSLNSSSNSLNSNCSSSNFHSSTTSQSSSNLTDLNEFHAPVLQNAHKKKTPKFTTVQSSFYLNNVPSEPLNESSRAKSSLEIFETESLYNNLSLSKNSQALEDKTLTEDKNKSDFEDCDKSSANETIVAVKSVKEHAKKLNRLNTQLELSQNSTPQKPRKYSLGTGKEQGIIKPIDFKIELENFDLTDPDPIEKEWILICSRCDYMEVAKWLSKYPYLAQKKDPFTGYTCAHWACKYGHIEILKLIASTLENDSKTNPKMIRINHLVNSRSRVGYTCLHIAYIFKHGDLAPLLKAYGAEGLIDYSGKQAIEYSGKNDAENFNLSRPQSFDISELFSDQASRKSASSTSSSLDINTFVKRTSSILLKEKDNDSKFLRPRTSTLPTPKTSTLQRVTHDSIKSNLPQSPLATIEPCQNVNSSTSKPGFLHPSVILRNKSKSNNNDEIYQNGESIGESKENIFI